MTLSGTGCRTHSLFLTVTLEVLMCHLRLVRTVNIPDLEMLSLRHTVGRCCMGTGAHGALGANMTRGCYMSMACQSTT